MLEIILRLFHNCGFKDVIISKWESAADLITSLLLSMAAASYKNFSLIHIGMAPGLATENSRQLLGKLNYASGEIQV